MQQFGTPAAAAAVPIGAAASTTQARLVPPLPVALRSPQLFPDFDPSIPLLRPLPPVLPENVRLRRWEVPMAAVDLETAAVSFPFERLDDVMRAAWKSFDAGQIDLSQVQKIEHLIELNRAVERRPAASKMRRQQRRLLMRSLLKRKKEFGDGSPQPLTAQEKKRILACALEMRRKTEKGMHYGKLTAKNCDVLRVLLYGFHNSGSGLCFPSYAAIAERAACCMETVRTSIIALEAVGLLTWVNRLVRVRIEGRIRVIRTSNGYRFRVPPQAAETAGRAAGTTGAAAETAGAAERNGDKLYKENIYNFLSETNLRSGTPNQESSKKTTLFDNNHGSCYATNRGQPVSEAMAGA